MHLLSRQHLVVVNKRDMLELLQSHILLVDHLMATAVGSGHLGEARGSCRMGDLTRLAGKLGGGWDRGIRLVGGLGGQGLVSAVSFIKV